MDFERIAGTPETSVLLRGTRHTAEGLRVECGDALIHEHALSVWVDGTPMGALVCTPNHIEEMVLGRLLTAGRIDSAGQVREVAVSPEADRVEVRLAGGVVRSGGMAVLPKVDVDPAAVFALARRFREDSALHKSTGGAHCCYVRRPGGEIDGFEDISRHNALDKAVGHMLRTGATPGKCMIFTTGRVPSDMVEKVIMARVPVLVSKSVPTDAAVRLAAKYNLQLLCRAWPDSFVIYRGEFEDAD